MGYIKEHIAEVSDLNFGNLNRVQINFVEMDRQKRRIQELGDSFLQQANNLSNSIKTLGDLVDYDASSILASAITQKELCIKSAVNNMDYQMNEYTKLNTEITENIKNTLNDLVDKMFKNGIYDPSNVYSFKDESGIIQNLSYNEVFNKAWANQGPMYPNFTNLDAWQDKNIYAQIGNTGQCTWFAWGRFYEIYGYDPGFRGNGYECVGQLLAAHPEEFYASDTPVNGSVFSTVPYFSSDGKPLSSGHVGIILAVDGDTITFQDGNYDNSSNSFEVAQSDWKTTTVTIDQFKSMMGQSVHFANPVVQVELNDSANEAVFL